MLRFLEKPLSFFENSLILFNTIFIVLGKNQQKFALSLEDFSIILKIPINFGCTLEDFVKKNPKFFVDIQRCLQNLEVFLPNIGLSFLEGGLEFFENGPKPPWLVVLLNSVHPLL